jgi:hypothetical protein
VGQNGFRAGSRQPAPCPLHPTPLRPCAAAAAAPQSEGNCFSLSALERRIGGVFFYWDVFNVFLQVGVVGGRGCLVGARGGAPEPLPASTLCLHPCCCAQQPPPPTPPTPPSTRPANPQGIIGSAFFQQLTNIIYRPQNLPQILGVSLPDSSNFFIQFIAMRAFFLVWLRMCVPHGGVWQNWCHYLFCPPNYCSVCNTGEPGRGRGGAHAPRCAACRLRPALPPNPQCTKPPPLTPPPPPTHSN